MNQNRTSSLNNCPESADKNSPQDSGQSSLNVLVLGVGNLLLSDEGAGIKVVEALQARYDFSDSVELIDGGTMGMELLPYFEARSHILIIDAVKTGQKPGNIVRIDDLPAFFQQKTSPHQIGLVDVMAAAALTEDLPRYIKLLGIEPKTLSSGLDLSPEVSENLDRLVDMVAAELKSIGVKVQPK